MSSKNSTTELWSASLLGEKGIGRKALEARKICNRWAEASIFRFVMINSILIFLVFAYVITR